LAAEGAQVIATWNGGNGSWGSAGNWSGGVVPNNNSPAGTTYDVRLDGGKPAASTVTLTSSTTVDLLTIDSGDRLNTGATSYVIGNGGGTTVNGLLSVDAGGQFLWNNLGGSVSGSGQYLLNGGLLSPNSAGSTAKLTINSSLIGRGQLGLSLGTGSGIVFDNNGLITNQSSAGVLFLRSRNVAGVESRNFGTIRASGNDGVIDITHGTIRQVPGFSSSTGAIEAIGDGTGSTVWIRSGVKIIGGRLDCYGGPGVVINVEGGATLERDLTQPVSFINGHSYVSWGAMNLFGGVILKQKTFFVDGGGTLDFKPGATMFNGGNITVDGATAKIGQGVTLDGVSLTTSAVLAGNGTVRIQNDSAASAAVLKNVRVDFGESGNGVVQIGSATGFGIADVQGTLTNNGKISILTSAASALASRIALTQDATIAGTGRLVFEPSTPALYGRVVGTNGTQTLTNAEGHTIVGPGAIGDLAGNDRLRLVNAGTIEASGGTLRMYLNAAAHGNTGVIRSRSNLLLGNLSDYTFNNSGQIIADGIGAMVQVGGNFSGAGSRGTFTGNGEWIADRGEMIVYGDVAFNTAANVISRNGGSFQYAGATMSAALISVDGSSFANLSTLSTLNANVTNNGVIAGKPLTVQGQTSGAKVTVNGTVRGSGSFSGNLLLNGTTNAGDANGTRGLLTMEVVTLAPSHTLVIDIAGASDLDRVVVGGEGVVAGRLQLNRVGGFVPAYGASQRILAAGFSTGQFTSIGGIQIDSLHSFAVVYDIGGVSAIGALPGDATLDRKVDFDDLLIIAQQYGRPNGQTWVTADFNGDGATSFDDLLTLAQRYGATALADADLLAGDGTFASDWALAVSIVPEPTLLIPMMVPATRRRR
jgi:hypothetical protein